ncbi:hypothetical protein BDY17DRAFT_26523 [Neohortaea acidophila]|uniref:Uncharacterized protein n=1 Tax=Neohortaea acidophila TaxID=245834 RepID=A0A6A6PIJ6_9PEZI|nr:uncharacterized protein BDY17DRAFT_26523 [Neohortaea acidophila]KAF2479812.1 hypothetical protein BDY17DRAFT_26523 [Neohortaea acidophila]
MIARARIHHCLTSSPSLLRPHVFALNSYTPLLFKHPPSLLQPYLSPASARSHSPTGVGSLGRLRTSQRSSYHLPSWPTRSPCRRSKNLTKPFSSGATGSRSDTCRWGTNASACGSRSTSRSTARQTPATSNSYVALNLVPLRSKFWSCFHIWRQNGTVKRHTC